MILFEKIRWKNFLSTGNQFTEFALNENSTNLIIGTNGAGKSTVLDALTFSLFGKPSFRVSSPDLIKTRRSALRPLSDHFHGLTGPFPCCTLGRLLVACVPSARSKWLLRGSDALDELLCLCCYTPQPSTSMGLEVSYTERMRARIGPAHSFSPPCSAHATDPCSRA